MAETVFMTGNEVAAEAALRCGVHFYAGYPITPQNELSAYMALHMPKRGRTFIQAESELASINLVLGASAAGARSMTTSSSPGVSLMQEGISYLAGSELPAVIINTMRGGPGLGNISGSQADYFQCTRGGGHGDYRTPTLAPWSVQEIADHTVLAFDLAERYRTPVLIAYDGFLGQLTENVALPEDRAAVSLEQPWALGDARGRPARVVRSLLMGQGELEEHNNRLAERYATLQAEEARGVRTGPDDAEVLLVAFGLCARQCAEALDRLAAGGVRAALFRPVTLWPFPGAALREAARGCRGVLCVEMSLGQMVEDVRLALEGTLPVELLGRAGGGVPTVRSICEKARACLAGETAEAAP
jgi:2-oxoglutarate/2-oxoacid ferredoxin oxidoreductase subunit alpha